MTPEPLLVADATAYEFSALYNDHHTWLRDWLRRRLGNARDAADVAHDAFLRLLVRPREFDTTDSARACLSTIANVFDKEYYSGLSYSTGVYGAPRTFTLTAKYSY